jgi:enoyl-CoA hydratase/carnithine racemase
MTLQVEREGALLRLALNRPEKRNALNQDLCRALVEAFDSAQADASIHAILLSGNGKSFCAGMDLAETAPADLADVHERLFTAGQRLTKPLIAAVHGAALAGGTGLAANAHVVVASDDATFGLTEIRIGLWPFLIFRAIAQALGERRAVELSLTGRIFGAADAQAWGLVHHAAPAADLMEHARRIALEIAAFSPLAIARGLEVLHASHGLSAGDAGRLAASAREEIFRSPEFQAGLLRFREKKP